MGLVVAGTNTFGWTALKDTQTGAVQALATQVANLLTDLYKEREIDAVVRDTNPNLQVVLKEFMEAIDAQIRNLDALDYIVVSRNATRLDDQLQASLQRSAAARRLKAAAAIREPRGRRPGIPSPARARRRRRLRRRPSITPFRPRRRRP